MDIKLTKEDKRNIGIAIFALLFISLFISISPFQLVTRSEKAMLYGNTAMADLQRKDLASAEKNFRKASLLDPRNEMYRESLGMTLSNQQEKLNEATEVFNKILEKNPNNLTALYFFGSYYQSKGDYEESKKKLQAYLDVNPQNPEVLTMLGVVYYKSGNKEGAKEQWQKALQIDQNFEAAQNNLATVESEK